MIPTVVCLRGNAKEVYFNCSIICLEVKEGQSLGNNKKEAQRGKFLKERLLREGQFDEVDIKKMPDEIRLILTQPLISLPDALERYLVATAAERQSNTNRNIRYPLEGD